MTSVKPTNIPEGDFANYFCTYGYLYHQKEMLEDPQRMQAYHDSIFLNKAQFKDKVVLDVGTGSGILAIWAAQAGARKVYAVEATNMAGHARKLADSNGVGEKIELIQGYMENIELPEKVDIIISEWMGYFLLRESMLDSVLVARDKWLKPGGALYPSHARMFISAIKSNTPARKYADYVDSGANWQSFTKTVADNYGVDMSCLTPEYDKEQSTFFLKTSQWVDLHPNQLLGKPCVLKNFDLNKVTVEEIKVVKESFELKVEPQHQKYKQDEDEEMGDTKDVQVSGFGGWFDVHFRGSEENPATTEVELSTAPDVNGATHWGQQCFYLHPAAVVGAGDSLHGNLNMHRSKENHRLMSVNIEFSHHRMVNGTSYAAPPRSCTFNIE
eukprot:CAMPEP_0196577162 /NCGR_PEP_ID=MMETSP1081-20130531/6275_1 /TAXON_ID=36882 /ORGANISM="Pyramimonas amylifera, Strain CCMP720" /LENGTH=384 /DNA_ID=CAMNT_0041896005 /DNA_START=31 /DNA_END=1185 /DNA_ORIENTATION=+